MTFTRVNLFSMLGGYWFGMFLGQMLSPHAPSYLEIGCGIALHAIGFAIYYFANKHG